MITSDAFSGKTYHVLGLARTGLSVIEALMASGAMVDAWDVREEARAALPEGVEAVDPMEADLRCYDALVVSPGVPLNTHPLAERAHRAGSPIIGDIELFAQARADLPAHKVVGITGTNGKSTVTALIHHVLAEAGVPTTLGGNIGLPILSQNPLTPNERGEGVYVLELSSYQIDLTQSLACDVAILLNISPDHLDRYDGSIDAYAASKARLFDMLSETGKAVIGGRDDFCIAIGQDHEEHSLSVGDDLLTRQDEWPALAGPHNRQNAAAAIAALRELKLTDADILVGFASFPGLPHRMEIIGTVGGVRYVNDSKATNPESTAPALAAFDHVHWIVGGRAKGADLDACLPHIGHVGTAYLIGESVSVFAEFLQGKVPEIIEAGTLANALGVAVAKADAGDTVLLSPAAASFDQYRDFEARGDEFRTLVERLGA